MRVRDPRSAHRRLGQRMVRAEPAVVDRPAGEQRAEGKRGPVGLVAPEQRSGGGSRLGLCPAADERGDRVPRHRPRDRRRAVAEQRDGRVPERVGGARGELVRRLRRAQRRVVDDHARPHARRLRGNAGGVAMHAGHLRRGQRGGHGHHVARTVGRRERLRDVDHPAAAERDQPRTLDGPTELGGDDFHEAVRHVDHCARALRELRRARSRPRGRQEGVAAAEQVVRGRERAGAEHDRPLGVDVTELHAPTRLAGTTAYDPETFEK